MNPDLFHGRAGKKGFFEGWYFRLYFGGRSICLIPGVAMGEYPCAFVQFADSHSRSSRMLRYDISDFATGRHLLNIRVGDSRFSLSSMELNLRKGDFSLTGRLHFDKVQSYPGGCSMSVAAHLPMLECYTQICALNGRVNGRLYLGSEPIEIRDGRLYAEKNWGRSFPSSYVWMQGIIGEQAGFSCSVGQVPLGRCGFEGMVACVYDGGDFYEFHSLKGARHSLQVGQNSARLEAVSGRYVLRLQAVGGYPLTLPAPLFGDMSLRILERLDARADLSLYDLRSGACLLRRNVEGAGLEMRR